jgi:hypothetical protein
VQVLWRWMNRLEFVCCPVSVPYCTLSLVTPDVSTLGKGGSRTAGGPWFFSHSPMQQPRSAVLSSLGGGTIYSVTAKDDP